VGARPQKEITTMLQESNSAKNQVESQPELFADLVSLRGFRPLNREEDTLLTQIEAEETDLLHVTRKEQV